MRRLLHLFLIEAKSALDHEDIVNMRERLQRTIKYISWCGSGQMEQDLLPLTNNHNALAKCKLWAMYAGATKVHGVIGGIGFTQQMLSTAHAEGLISIVPGSGMYDIHVPGAGLTNFLPVLEADIPGPPDNTTEQVAIDAVTQITEDAVFAFVSNFEASWYGSALS